MGKGQGGVGAKGGKGQGRVGPLTEPGFYDTWGGDGGKNWRETGGRGKNGNVAGKEEGRERIQEQERAAVWVASSYILSVFLYFTFCYSVEFS